MDRAALKPFGFPILRTKDVNGHYRALYTVVSVDDSPVGIALYHFYNESCSSAIIDDRIEGSMFISHIDEDHPYDEEEIKELNKIYNWAFK